jgi:adenosylhomocysteine nucleosidase
MNRWPMIVFALRREAMYFRRLCSPRPLASCPFATLSLGRLAEKPLLLLETGIGPSAMGAALCWSFDLPFRPPLVLSAGFSGALQPEQRVGDLVLANEVIDTQGNRWLTTWPGDGSGPFPLGRLLTLETLLTEPSEKLRLGRQYEASAVDMETAMLAQLCSQHQLPFGSLRVISDDVRIPLSPQLVELLQGGRVAPFRVAQTLLRKPSIVQELWRLAAQTRAAARQLSTGLQTLLRPFLLNSYSTPGQWR